MTPSRESYIARLVSEHQRARDHHDEILDGRACLVCGGTQAAMIPVGQARGGGQVFAHEECDRAMRVAKR